MTPEEPLLMLMYDTGGTEKSARCKLSKILRSISVYWLTLESLPARVGTQSECGSLGFAST